MIEENYFTMEFIDIPTEQTTAVTDLLLMLLFLVGGLHLKRFRAVDPWKVNVWTGAFGLSALSAFLGAVQHGLKLSATTSYIIDQPFNLSIAFATALYMIGAVYDMWGRQAARRISPIMLGMGLLCFAVTLLVSGVFLILISYMAMAMVVALVIYIRLAVQRQRAGSSWMVCGIVIMMISVIVQVTQLFRFTFIWEFDANGVFHLIYLMGTLAIIVGLHISLREATAPSSS